MGNDRETLYTFETYLGIKPHENFGMMCMFIPMKMAYPYSSKGSLERKMAENAPRLSEERYRNLFESMVRGVVYQDAEGWIILANPAAERILGLTLEEMQDGSSLDSRWKAIHEDGSDFPGDTHPSMVALATGNVVENVVMGVFNPKRFGI